MFLKDIPTRINMEDGLKNAVGISYIIDILQALC